MSNYGTAIMRMIARSATAGVSPARSTLALAKQTLSTGQAALSVDTTTLATLRQLSDVNAELPSLVPTK